MSRVIARNPALLHGHLMPQVGTPQWIRHASSSRRSRGGFGPGRVLGLITLGVASGIAIWVYPTLTKEPPKPQRAEVVFEKSRKLPESKEENGDLVSSQHLQVKKSWENPGVYAWGSNSGKVAAPNSNETVIKTPRRIPYFDGQLLRDLKLDRNFGAAVTEDGDLVQWGAAFSRTSITPTLTLKGKDLVKLAISRDRIIALSSNGNVYSVPVSSADQASGPKPQSTSWLSFWSGPSTVGYRMLKPQTLGYGERITDISGGLEHCLMLTSKGRVFSAASSFEAFPSKGQLGVPGLTWETSPKGPSDQPHEIGTLRGFRIVQIATGDYHSLVLDSDGKVFSFGDNSTGQLGFEPAAEIPFVDVPTLVSLHKLYAGTGMTPRVTSIFAGGSNSFFAVDATKALEDSSAAGPARNLGRVVSDVWACGEGIYGSLGTGRWTHISTAPTKIKALSNLFEFDEEKNKAIPIRLAQLSVGSTHSAAIMDNVTYVNASKKTSDNDTNWGADVVWWGGNEHYQLGTGKRNNVNAPTYIAPLDGGKGDAEKGREGEVHRFQITPRTTARLGEGAGGRKVSVEQRVECGRFVTGVYSGT